MTGQQLKNSILQLAIQGKLVPQIESEGTAEDLLKEIRAEKEKLVKEGKLKKKDLEVKPIEDDEIPFEIPEEWRWCRLGEIGSWGSGATPAKGNPEYYTNGDIPWLRTGELNNGYVYDSEIKVTKAALDNCSLRMCKKGDVLIAMYGATIGKVAIAGIELTTNQACCACTPVLVFNEYLMWYLMASKQAFIELGEGGAQPNISREKIVAFPFPLPPLSEQKRIVAKIEELMPMVEEYGKAQERLETLNRELPEKLKKSVLQEAIMGKLVPQDPKEGTAEELLEEIRKEKEKLVKEGKLKKKDLEVKPIEDDEIPFEIPEGWRWCRYCDVFRVINGDRGKNYPSKDKLSNTGIPFVSALNLSNNSIAIDDRLLCVSEKQFDLLGSGKINKGDTLVCIRGSLGKHGIYPLDRGAIASSLVICRSFYSQNYLSSYLSLYLDSELFKEEIRKYDNGTAQPNLAAKSLEEFLFPLPPLSEQKRIVAKVEEVMKEIEGVKK